MDRDVPQCERRPRRSSAFQTGQTKACSRRLLFVAYLLRAARGVILPLLSYGCSVVVTNRTFERAQHLSHIFESRGEIQAIALNDLKSESFDLIINATASGIKGEIPAIPKEALTPQTRIYDMYYQAGPTPFIEWAQKNGVTEYADGLGMLVGQADSTCQIGRTHV